MRRSGFSAASVGLKTYATVQQDTYQRDSMEHSLTFLIGMVWLLVGTALPVCDALMREGKHIKEINMVETLSIIQDSLSIFGIIYIQAFMSWYQVQDGHTRSFSNFINCFRQKSIKSGSKNSRNVESTENPVYEQDNEIDEIKITDLEGQQVFYIAGNINPAESTTAKILQEEERSSPSNGRVNQENHLDKIEEESETQFDIKINGNLSDFTSIYEDTPPRTLDIGRLDVYGPRTTENEQENSSEELVQSAEHENSHSVTSSISYEDGPPRRLDTSALDSYLPPKKVETEEAINCEIVKSNSSDDMYDEYEEGPPRRLDTSTLESYKPPKKVDNEENEMQEQKSDSISNKSYEESQITDAKDEELETSLHRRHVKFQKDADYYEDGPPTRIGHHQSEQTSPENPSRNIDIVGTSPKNGSPIVHLTDKCFTEIRTSEYEEDRPKLVIGKDGFIRNADDPDIDGSIDSEIPQSIEDVSDKKSRSDFQGFNTNFSNDSEGVNMFLRLGLIGFGLGVMMLDGIRAGDLLQTKGYCDSYLKLLHYITHFIWTLLQTFFLFKNHNIIINFHKLITRLMIMHLLIANISQWTKTVVHEVEEYMYYNLYYSKNYTSSKAYNASGVNCKETWSKKFSPYLFPCQIEFSLISAAIFFKILKTVGKILQETIKRRSHQETSKYPVCHKSHRGFFIGLVLVMATVILVALTQVLETDTTGTTLLTIFTTVELVLQILVLFLCVLAMKKIYRFHIRNNTKHNSVDRNLLVIGMAGIISYNLFVFVGACDNNKPKYETTAALMGTKAFVEIIQSCCQVLLITEASKRYVLLNEHARNKPGRALIISILMCNLGFWLINTFGVKQTASKVKLYEHAFGQVSWAIVFNMCLPMIIFYRFHSTVCFSEIWSETFKQHWAQ